jgi:hypothetical protein
MQQNKYGLSEYIILGIYIYIYIYIGSININIFEYKVFELKNNY